MATPASAHGKGREDDVPPREHKELHLYPGEKRLLFVVDAKLVLNVEAWGGPQFSVPKRPNEKVGADPTTAGRFRVGLITRYVTSTWKWSKIAWGTRLKAHPTNSKDVLYEASPGQWRSVFRQTAKTRQDIEARYEELHQVPDLVPPTWVFNEFGPVAIRYYEDRNNNRKQDPSEKLSGEMFHTTAENEADPTSGLFTSHGCIHMRPIDRDALIDQNAFAVGTLVVIHNYGETSGVPRRSAPPGP